jgi:hypothetical protein
MEDTSCYEVNGGESYRSLLKSYYDRLQAQRDNPNNSALEEVRLRLFLSLLEKPTSSDIGYEGSEVTPFPQ